MGYKKYCGPSCKSKDPVILLKSKTTHLTKYGVEHYSKTKEHTQRVKTTKLKKYGVEYPLQRRDIYNEITSNICGK